MNADDTTALHHAAPRRLLGHDPEAEGLATAGPGRWLSALRSRAAAAWVAPLTLLAVALLAWHAAQGRPAPVWIAPSMAIAAKLLPLYLVVLLGAVLGRALEVDRSTVGTVLVRAVSPVVFLGAMASTPVAPRDLALPALFLAMPTLICLAARRIVQPLLAGSEAQLAAFLAGSANVGYFGVPAALAVLPAHALGAYMLCLLGFAVYENTVGYYMLARGRASARESLLRVARLPAMHAIALGLAANWASLSGGPELRVLWEAFKGCYVVLGMLALGLGIARLPALGATLRFVAVTASTRFALWPLAAVGLVAADAAVGSPFGADVQRIALLLAALPCATSGAIFAAELGLEPEKAAASVLVTTVLALLSVPLLPLLLPFLIGP